MDLGECRGAPVVAARLSIHSGQCGRHVNADLAVILHRTGVKWQKGVAVDIGRKSFLRGGVRVDQFLMVLEDRLDDFIDEVVGQVLVDHGKNINAERMIICGQRRIRAGWNEGR